MGLVRIALVLQGRISNFEPDLFRPIMERAAQLLGTRVGASTSSDISLQITSRPRRLICDGILPANDGRGYVMRKIMRCGIRQGTLLGFKGTFLFELSSFVTELMKDPY